jgi:Zn-finger nucleic acid-binding protein
MREVAIGDTDLLECATCHAVWVEAATFEHICAEKVTQAAVLHQWPAAPVSQPAEIHYRRCVMCHQMMNRLNFGRLSGTVVDVCKGHGTLLDAGELHQIVSFIQNGGLDRARQRQIEDLKDAEAQLRAAQNEQASHHLATGDMSVSWSSTTFQGSLLDLIKRLKATDE